uniref:Uncharacterized protein n=1 Tax=Vespula pensylvanica TaxID=30213 RepID=A0A834KUZ5_VESPE|nr:hypothetical protein H0235_013278 [Vespula pensylvanica]
MALIVPASWVRSANGNSKRGSTFLRDRCSKSRPGVAQQEDECARCARTSVVSLRGLGEPTEASLVLPLPLLDTAVAPLAEQRQTRIGRGTAGGLLSLLDTAEEGVVAGGGGGGGGGKGGASDGLPIPVCLIPKGSCSALSAFARLLLKGCQTFLQHACRVRVSLRKRSEIRNHVARVSSVPEFQNAPTTTTSPPLLSLPPPTLPSPKESETR